MHTWILTLALLVAPAASAQESQIKKAEAAFTAFQGGDTAALADAIAAVDRATVHKKTASKGSAWVLKGRIFTAVALQAGIPTPEQVDTAVAAWEGAVERGAGEGAISEDLIKLLSATSLVLRDDLESKRIDEAWRRVDAAMRGRGLLESVGWDDPRIEAPLLQLAILTGIRAGKLDEAKMWFADWRAMDAFEPSVAVQVASAIAEAEGADAGVAFLEPLLQQRPLDTAMLTRVVEILMAADRAEDAKARVVKASKAKDAGGSGSQLLLGQLYTQVGAKALAKKAFASALDQNSEAAEAWVPLALLLMEAPAVPDDPKEAKAVADNHKIELARAAGLLEKARDAAGGTPSKEVLTAMVQVYGELGREEDKATAEKALQSAP